MNISEIICQFTVSQTDKKRKKIYVSGKDIPECIDKVKNLKYENTESLYYNYEIHAIEVLGTEKHKTFIK